MGVVMSKRKVVGLIVVGVLALVAGRLTRSKKTDLHSTSVMITNRAQNHGGTGIILSSGPEKSFVLTNAHVCKVVTEGGVVVTNSGGLFQVNSVRISEVSDLCILSVLNNLNSNTYIATSSPEIYDAIKISGHPALMPNIISIGHLSGQSIIQVMTGIRPCTDDDINSPNNILCAFMGGIPVIKSYQSRLVSATIMPGSSGSGVYNKNNQLIGVVFAGQGDFGYGWTVPYEQLVNFVQNESPKIPETLIKQELNLSTQTKSKLNIKDLLLKCSKLDSSTNKKILNVCEILSRDVLWHR
jgi:S1-C subfamily serine protease